MTEDLLSPLAADGDNGFPIVGVGASAGGLEAIEQMFEEMPLHSGMAFVVVQHLSPDFKSHMAELLERKTKIPVRRVIDGMVVEPNHIYLIPAKKEMVIADGKLRLTERSSNGALSHPIDIFFRSLAADVGRRAVAIVLSGTGSDGSRGIIDVKKAGGLVLAQVDSSAKFDGMPINAVATGAVDLTLIPAAMPETLRRYVTEKLSPEAFVREDPEVPTVGIDKIFELLRSSYQIDFSHYKASTVGRRVYRRMQMQATEDIERYCTLLETNAEELDALYRDLLIGVTRFFRDGEAFEILEEKVLPELMKRARQKGQLRVWVAGCASGEEAYSLAILIDEHLRRHAIAAALKIFATDIHPGSLAAASAGIYPTTSLGEMSEARRNRYFIAKKDGFQVSRELRGMIVFAPHNVFHDAPFTQLDLITCRNLLIYLQPAAQKKALSLFHFGLRAGGVLFLGSSETPGDLQEEFEEINSRWRIYRKRRDIRLPVDPRLPFAMAERANFRPVPRASTRAGASGADASLMAIYDRLLDMHMPSSILVDSDSSILHIFGGAEQYLKMRSGRQSSYLPDLIEPRLRTPVIGAIEHCLKERKEVYYSGLEPQSNDEELSISVVPLADSRTMTTQLLLRFHDAQSELGAQLPDGIHARRIIPPSVTAAMSEVDLNLLQSERVESLETELRFSRENLQASIEELETSNEELQAANEEMLASNEELQSTNEELQSVNEELYTVNTEHQKKIEELMRANDDMDNLLALTQVGVIFLDEDRCIRRFTPEIGRSFHMLPQDIGRPFQSFENNLGTRGITALIDQALEGECHVEMRVEDRGGKPYLLRVAPYRRSDQVRGVAVTLVDVSVLERSQSDTRKFKHMVEQANDIFMLVDQKGIVAYANEAVIEAAGVSPTQVVGANVQQVFGDLTMASLAAALRGEQPSANRRALSCHASAGEEEDSLWDVVLNPIRISGADLVFVAARNVSERRRAEDELRLYKSAIDSTMNGVTIVDARAKDQPLIFANEGFSRMTGYSVQEVLGKNCRFLQGEGSDNEAREKLRRAIAKQSQERVTIRNFKKDGAGFWNDVSINPVCNAEGAVTHFVGIQNDVSRAIETGIAAAEREARLSTLIHSTAEGIFGVDAAGRCNFCNLTALRLLGLSTEEDAQHRSIHELLSLSESESIEDGFSVLRGSVPVRLTNRVLHRRDGTPFAADISMQPILGEGVRLGNVITFSDITERMEQEDQLRAAREAADAANRAKSEFLANMSHELRTPLTAVMGFTDLLEMGSDPEDSASYVTGIKRNAKALLGIVNDILDLAKIEAERVDLQLEPIALVEVLADVRSSMHVRAAEAKLELLFSCTTPLPRTISSDRVRLQQILLNLVGNAIKFTPQGSVKVCFEHLPEQELLRFQVIDTGIGIAEEDQLKLFHPFQQADPSIERRFGGTGLGLSITKKLVERLGGQVRLESVLGEGTTVHVELPIGPVAPDMTYVQDLVSELHLEVEERPADLPAVHGRILLIDDQDDVRNVASQILSIAGAEVTTVSNGADAVAFVNQFPRVVDLIMLDLQMPGMSGFETLTKLREGGFVGPVVAFTAQVMKGERQRCIDAGFDDYVAKPIVSRTLLETVRMRLRARPSEHRLRILLVDDDEDTTMVLGTLIRRSVPSDVRTARNGADAEVAFATFDPHLCFLDHQLPDTDGKTLRRRLKAANPDREVIFIALTGSSGEGFDEFDEHILKPISLETLKSLLTRIQPTQLKQRPS